MKSIMQYTFGLMLCGLGAGAALAGQATTSAGASNGWGNDGTAVATANYDGIGGDGFARTRTDTGELNRSRALAVGYDREGLDFSLSHAVAPRLGPAYAGTFNVSIGQDGQVSGSYGGVVSHGGLTRSVEAGGMTRSDRAGGTAVAHANGEALPHGHVVAQTNSYQRRPATERTVRPLGTLRNGAPTNIRSRGVLHGPARVARAAYSVRSERDARLGRGAVGRSYR
jgi:hypothetical protein